MAKFINNNVISVQNRRAAAQGLNMAALQAAILEVSEAAKAAVDRGSFGSSEGYLPSKNHEEMACKISSLVGYSGGYMYGGDYATVIGGDPYTTRFQHLCHWVREYDKREAATFVAGNLAVLESLEEGTTLRLGYSGQDSSWEEWVLTGGVWIHTSSYSGFAARWEEERFQRETYLFSGIRAAVAEDLGVEADYGFHKLFDEAIVSLDK